MGTILLAFLFMLAGQAPSTHEHQNTRCSYFFQYPPDWQVVKNPGDVAEECVTTLRPADYEKRMAEFDVDVYTLTVQVYERSFLQVADENGFDFNGEWVVVGRQGATTGAEVSNNNGWLILSGTAGVGCFHEKGGYAGLCEEKRVVAKYESDHRIVAISGNNAYLVDTILKTFKFLPR
jgi:hypothetical protein